MEPELDNGSVVELVYLAAHGDEAVAVLNLLDVFFPGRLRGDLTEHGLGGCKPTEEGAKSARRLEKIEGDQTEGGGGKRRQSGGRERERKRKKQRAKHEKSVRMTAFKQIKWHRSRTRGRHRQCHHSKT